MSHMRSRAKSPRLRILLLAAVAALVVAGVASAEFPYMNTGPSVLGTPQEGQTLSGRTGLWLYTSGLKCEPGDCNYRYTWQRCAADGSGCADISGATAFSYTLTAADVGMRVRFVEWVHKYDCGEWTYEEGTQECRDVTKNGVSALTNVVAPRPITIPQSTAPPSISGRAMEDEVLRATPGTWVGQGTIATVMQWQRCNISGEGCETIANAVGLTYRLIAADVDRRVRAIEVASNQGGTTYAPSAPSAVVAELRPTASRKVVAIGKVTLPHQLVLDRVVLRQSGPNVTLLVKVSDDRGFRISGARVWVTPTALLSGSPAARVSNRNGWATFRYVATGSGATYVYVEARRAGEKAQTGISTANLFRVTVRG